jgi:hypothetical protein
VPSVLPEDTFVEIFEGRLSVAVIGADPGPIVATPVAGGPLGESLELAGCVPAVIPAVTTAAFPFVLEIPLEAVVQRAFRTG